MPVDLKKFRRIFLIHQKLRTRRQYEWQELAEACEQKLDVKVSQRSIEYDISALKNTFFAPVRKRKGKYGYDDTPYSIFEVFDNSAYGSLNELLALLRQKSKEWGVLDEFLLRLEQKIGVLGGEENTIIDFEQTPLKGLENLEKLYKTIKENRTLKVMYEPYNLPIYARIIKPVLLKQYNNRWFLFGWEKEKNTIQNLPLDRIDNFSFWHENMKIQGQFDAKTYFKDIIGVTLNNVAKVDITFKILKNRAFYVETKKIHHTQQLIIADETSITFKISVKPNNEMWAKFMELAEDLTIISPNEIQDEMRGRIKKI